MGWPEEPPFYVPEDALRPLARGGRRAARRSRPTGATRLARLHARTHPEPRGGAPAVALGRAARRMGRRRSRRSRPSSGPLATRQASGLALQAIAAAVPNLVGGSADLGGSTGTTLKQGGTFGPATHRPRRSTGASGSTAMAACLNGIAAHGGLRPFGSTFLVFSDYMKPAIRLAAIMRLPVIYIGTHDSIGVGRGRPHPPADRAPGHAARDPQPGRPPPGRRHRDRRGLARRRWSAPDGPDDAGAHPPEAARCSTAPRSAPAAGVGARRATCCSIRRAGTPQAILIATGSEVHVALAAAKLLQADRVRVRVVSMPSWELFAAAAARAIATRCCRRRCACGSASRRRPRSAGSAGSPTTARCSPWTGFGASAPGDRLFEEFKFTPERAAASCAAARAATRSGRSEGTHERPTQSAGPPRRAGPEPVVRLHHPRPVTTGELARLIAEDGLRGMTSNPTIFEKAIAGQPAVRRRDPALDRRGPERAGDLRAPGRGRRPRRLRRLPPASTRRPAAADGLVSLEVSPTLAHDTDATIHEAERLWRALDRPNAMIKIPGTAEGLPAITHCIAAGISVNVTLLFSVERYGEVIEAFLAGLERAARGGAAAPADRLGGELLREPGGRQGRPAARPAGRPAPAPRHGSPSPTRARRTGCSSGRSARRGGSGSPRPGARPQRPLWASTSTKDPRYPDVHYVEALVAPRTVNTLPPETFAAYRDHGRPAVRIQEGMAAAPGAAQGAGRARHRPRGGHPRARGRTASPSSRRRTRSLLAGHRGQGRRAGRPLMLRALRSLSLTWWIFIGMGAGILIGWLAPEFAATLKPLSTVFLRMIKSVVVPIIFGTLVVGIAGHGDDLKRIGRLAVKSIGYFWLMTTIALAVGLIAVNITRPGVGVVLPAARPQRRHPQGRAHHLRRVPRARRAPELLRGRGATTRCCRWSSGPRSSPSR